MQVIPASLYDYPKYCDLLYASDSKQEFDFLEACLARHAKRPVRRVFEPACGTGRLLARFAAAGYETAGNDLSPKAVAYCNARLLRQGLPATAHVGDMADFRLPRKVDAAFNLLSTFRHLDSEAEAESHLRCVADALADGGVYVLGNTSEPLCQIPVALNRIGVVQLAGLNPLAAAVEAGIEIENIAESGLIDFQQLQSFWQL